MRYFSEVWDLVSVKKKKIEIDTVRNIFKKIEIETWKSLISVYLQSLQRVNLQCGTACSNFLSVFSVPEKKYYL